MTSFIVLNGAPFLPDSMMKQASVFQASFPRTREVAFTASAKSLGSKEGFCPLFFEKPSLKFRSLKDCLKLLEKKS